VGFWWTGGWGVGTGGDGLAPHLLLPHCVHRRAVLAVLRVASVAVPANSAGSLYYFTSVHASSVLAQLLLLCRRRRLLACLSHSIHLQLRHVAAGVKLQLVLRCIHLRAVALLLDLGLRLLLGLGLGCRGSSRIGRVERGQRFHQGLIHVRHGAGEAKLSARTHVVARPLTVTQSEQLTNCSAFFRSTIH